MLALFALLGTAYIGYMTVELESSTYEVRQLRVRHLAKAGLYAAIGEVQEVLAQGDVPGPTLQRTIPVYDQSLEAHPQTVDVAISDESARINLNLAPREVLEALGFTRSEVRELKRDLPRQNVQLDSGRRWLLSIDDLRRRNYLNAESFAKLDRDMLTVYSADPANPDGYINLNAAPPAVLTAVLNLPDSEAAALVSKRPFESWEDVVEKAERQPESFNIKPSIDNIGGMPAALALSSRCYRFVSTATLEVPAVVTRRLQHAVEAVVYFNPDGTYEIRYWRERSGAEADEAAVGAEIAETTDEEKNEGEGPTDSKPAESDPESASSEEES